MIKSAAQSSLLNDTRYTSMSAGVVPSSEYLISTTLLDTATPSVTFDVSSFAGVYKHLKIIAVVRTAVAATASQIGLQLDGNTSAASYAFHQLYGNGTVAGSEGYATGTLGMVTPVVRTFGATGTASAFGAGIIEILDAYSTTKNKTVRSLHGGAGVNHIGLTSGVLLSTSPTDSITFLVQGGGNLVAGSRFSLYGVTA
jgi:hypothetical protein